jgi:type I restriction enzyme S subunit
MSTGTTEGRVLHWVGGLPERWETAALGTRLKENKSSNKGLAEKQVLSLSYGRVVVKPEENLRGLVPESFETYQILEPGDIVIRPTDLQNDQTSLRIGQSHFRGIITSAYIAVRPQLGMNHRYAAYMLAAYDFMKVFYGFGSGLRQNLDFKHIKHIPIPVPSPEEQVLIVRYLDHAELRIAKAIAGKNEVLARLREAKTAVISELVIGEHGERTDIGVPGLGEVPSHWRLRRAKYVWRAVNVRSATGTEERLTVSSARGIVPRASTTVTMFEAASYVGHKVVQPGNLVINSLWSWATGLGVSKHHGIVSPVYGVYTLIDDQCDVAYLDHLLRSNACQWQFQVRSKGIWKSRLSLTDEAFLDMMLVLPPLEEQQEIARRIGERTSAIDTATDAVNGEIALLKEYRTRLISDVVTGKIDVREEAAKLPDIDPAELVAVLAGGAAGADEEEVADGDD